MQSRKLFDGNRLDRPRRQKSVLRVLVVSILAPGVGHFLVGRSRTAAILLATMCLAAVAGTVASFLEIPGAPWLIGRLGLILVLFSIADATFLRVEANDGRSWGRRDRPRLAAALDLMGYGVSAWRRGHKGLAGLAFVFGGIVHIFLGSQNLPLRVLSEILVLAWAFYSWRTAKEEAALQHVHVKTDFDQFLEKDRDEDEAPPEPPKPPRDQTPAWVLPTLSALVGLAVLGMIGMYAVASNIEESLKIDRTRVLSMEPFFRNTEYGVALEMNAPGWTFLTPTEDQILAARHVSQGVNLHLSVQPRMPFFTDDRTSALGAMAEAVLHGTLLNAVEERSCEVGGRPGYYLRAEGRHGRDPVVAEIWTTGKGWREYVLWIEYDPRHDEFAAQEASFLLDHLSIENGRPELLNPDTTTAR